MIGAEGVDALHNASVAVFGLGGVGGSCMEALVRGGIGALALVDGDAVQPSNLNRQAIAFTSTVGKRKTDVAAAMARDINPVVRIASYPEFVLPERVPSLLDDIAAQLGAVDFIVDAVDTVATKLALAEAAERAGISFVSSMGAANKTDPTAFAFADIYETSACPLCRAVRKEARKRGIAKMRVLYSAERVSAPAGREHLGTMSYAPPIMGQMIAGDVIRSLLRMAS